MKRWILRVVTAIQASGSLAFGGARLYVAVGTDGGWDDLSVLCRISIILWVIISIFILVGWARCRSSCKGSPFPDGCRSECDALWGGLLVLETALLGLACGVIHLPSGPPQ